MLFTKLCLVWHKDTSLRLSVEIELTNNCLLASLTNHKTRERLRGEMAKILDRGLEVSHFELQSSYYVHLWIDTPGKGMNPLTPHLWV